MTAKNDGEGGSKAGAPLLMLDTGGHMALIKDIAFTPDGQQLVSASDDKTIRVWELARDPFSRNRFGIPIPLEQ